MTVLAVAVPTLIGSICSVLAASFIFVCYASFSPKAHFRHILILNLAFADFVNSLNNSISGIYAIAHGSIPPSPACTINGFVGQISVQATDFSILMFAVMTVVVLKKPSLIPRSSLGTKILLTVSVWFVPIITSTTGLGLHAYEPVSGNWCWIDAQRPALRYALTHGWRFAIILITLSIYVYLLFYTKRAFSEESAPASFQEFEKPVKKDTDHVMTAMADPYHFPNTVRMPRTVKSVYQKQMEGEYPLNDIDFKLVRGLGRNTYHTISDDEEEDETRDLLAATWLTNYSPYSNPKPKRRELRYDTSIPLFNSPSPNLVPQPLPPTEFADMANLESERAEALEVLNNERNRKIRKALMLNAYPIAYILLWLPGLANRLVELGTGKTSFVLTVMQSSTQFVGVANAITYGYNERVRMRVKRWLTHD